MVSAIVKRCKALGLRAGIVSRGYGGEAQHQPLMLSGDTPVGVAGDEPTLHFRQSDVPVCVCVKRVLAVQHLIEHSNVDVVISDDGLQHYAMGRALELIVIDGTAGIGNGFLLPAGPLRETAVRLQSAGLIAVQTGAAEHATVHNSDLIQRLGNSTVPLGHFHLQLDCLRQLGTEDVMPLSALNTAQVHAVAGIGRPQRFFKALRSAGLHVIEHPMPDHHAFAEQQLQFDDDLPVLVTTKDAVKLAELSLGNVSVYEVIVSPVLDNLLLSEIDNALRRLSKT